MSDENRGIVCLIFGALVFFCLAGYFERTVPPQTNLVCNDGWESGSIGRQGACREGNENSPKTHWNSFYP